MSVCGQSPLFIPTTVNAQIKNIDAVDVAATNISCTNLTVDGEPLSTVYQNIGSSTPGVTVFTGEVQAETVTITDSLTSNNLSTGAIVATFGNFSEDVNCSNLEVIGEIVQTDPGATATLKNINCGVISQTSGNTLLLATTVASLATAGNITQTGGSASLRGTTVTSLTSTGNVTLSGTSASLAQSGASATASLKAVSCTTLAPSSNITQSGGTATLKATTVDSLTTAGNITQTAGSTYANALYVNNVATYPKVISNVISLNTSTASVDVVTSIPTWAKKITILFNDVARQNLGAGRFMQIRMASTTNVEITNWFTTCIVHRTTTITPDSHWYANNTGIPLHYPDTNWQAYFEMTGKIEFDFHGANSSGNQTVTVDGFAFTPTYENVTTSIVGRGVVPTGTTVGYIRFVSTGGATIANFTGGTATVIYES